MKNYSGKNNPFPFHWLGRSLTRFRLDPAKEPKRVKQMYKAQNITYAIIYHNVRCKFHKSEYYAPSVFDFLLEVSRNFKTPKTYTRVGDQGLF